jgi:putative membrane protein
MKYITRVFLFNVFALWLTSELIPALNIHGSWQAMLIAGGVLSVLMLVVKPVLKILFIPINILTFGLLSWFINVIVLYLLTILVTEVEVKAWTYPGLVYGGFVIPPVHLTYLVALIATSLSVTFISNFLHDISEG